MVYDGGIRNEYKWLDLKYILEVMLKDLLVGWMWRWGKYGGWFMGFCC